MEFGSGPSRQFRYIAVLRMAALMGLGIGAAFPAWADCSFRSGKTLGTASITLPPQIIVPRDAAVGSIIYDSQWLTAGPTAVTCVNTFPVSYGYASGMTPVSGSATVYQTGVSGIGVQTSWVNSTVYTAGPTLTWPASTISVSNPGTNDYGPLGQYRMQLVVTGPVTPGASSLPRLLATTSYGSLQVNQLVINNTTVVAPSCTVQTSSIAVNMPKVSASSFPSVGSTVGNTGFNIALSCSGGMQIAMTITDATQPGNTSNNLTLSPGSTARGVAYQILYNNAPVSYGPDSAVAGTINQFSVGTKTSAGTQNVPLTARYVRTGLVTPGTANADATFTMSYL